LVTYNSLLKLLRLPNHFSSACEVSVRVARSTYWTNQFLSNPTMKKPCLGDKALLTANCLLLIAASHCISEPHCKATARLASRIALRNSAPWAFNSADANFKEPEIFRLMLPRLSISSR
jgi:hypothetical protein